MTNSMVNLWGMKSLDLKICIFKTKIENTSTDLAQWNFTSLIFGKDWVSEKSKLYHVF